MDSILSITVRDTAHPCAPYQSTRHSFFVQILHCDGKPLFWKGINYKRFRLNVRGHGGGFIHAQVKVPPGCYVLRAVATCHNVVTNWASVQVCCAETVCVDLLPTSVFHCINNTITGLLLGTVGERPVIEIAPQEVDEAVRALRVLAERLPKDVHLSVPPTEEEIKEEEQREDPGDDEEKKKKK